MNRVTLLFTLLVVSLLFGQKEAGDFDRPSLTYMNHLLMLDQSVKALPEKYRDHLIIRMGKQITMPRYDYNNIPEKLHTLFSNEVITVEKNCHGNSDACLSGATQLMERTVVPPILSVVEAHRDVRAQERMSEQQRNSFITDKAKELGFTEEEVQRVKNSAYIFMPFASDYREREWRDTIYYTDTLKINGKITLKITARIKEIKHYYNTSMSMGLAWWKIVVGTEGKPGHLEFFEPLYDQSSHTVELKKRYTIDQKPVDPKHYARLAMVNGLGTDFGQRLRDFEAFKLSGQVLESRAGFVGFDLGEREGIQVDDVFWVLENVEEGGKTVQKKNGWVMVRKVADSSSAEGYKSKAQVIGGHPYIGAVLKEYPMMSGKSSIMFQNIPYTLVGESEKHGMLQGLELGQGFGPRLEIGGHIGRDQGISQFFFILGGGFSMASADGQIGDWDVRRDEYNQVILDTISNDTIYDFSERHRITGVVAGHYDLSFMKRFYAKRFGFVFQAGGGYQHLKFKLNDNDLNESLDTDSLEYKLRIDSWGGFANAFAELAISPTLGIGAGAGYRYFAPVKDFQYMSRVKDEEKAKWETVDDLGETPEVHGNGMTFSVYFTFRPAISLRD